MLSIPTVAALIDLARRSPAPPGYVLPDGAEGEALDEFEQGTGLALSEELRVWLGAVNGAMIGPGGLFGVGPVDDFLSISEVLRLYPEWRDKGWVPIASDGTGNYWVTAPSPDGRSGWVAFVDCHDDPVKLDRFVASGVLRFLDFLLRSELGERGWPGNRKHVLARDPELSEVAPSLAPWRPERLPGRAYKQGIES